MVFQIISLDPFIAFVVNEKRGRDATSAEKKVEREAEREREKERQGGKSVYLAIEKKPCL